uniref:protein-tyrosine-phosphatase n=1 Tax=Ciona savignyi TaxID=51511 RepID=H2YZV1_CIOSA
RIVYPRFSIPPRKSYDVKINDPFNLTCVAVGSPMPVVKWQKQTSGGLVDVWPLKGMPPIVGMNVYHMQRVTESANYTCVAKSRISTITTTTEVTVKSVPKAPTNVHQYSDATSTTLSVAWDSGDLPPATVTGYTVFYRVMGSTTPYQYIDQISSESFTITGLQPYTEYDVVLMASNAQGQGNTTQPVYLRTAEAAPRSAPREVGAYLYQTNTIMVTWLEPQHPNGVISSYNVYYTSNPSLPVSEWMDVPVRNDRRLTALRRLVPHVTYSIRVSATNGAGESPYSDIAVVKTTHGVPPQPRNFHGEAASTTSIHLTWDRPNWGGASSFDITSYMVFYNCSSPSCSSQITFEPVKEFTLGRLRPNTRYDIRLAAQTVHGVGAETSMISVSTLSDGKSVLQATDMQVNGTSVVVQGLQPYTEYDVWLTASTTVGEGPRANAVVTTSQSTPAAPPSDVDLQALNSSAVRVRWSPLPTHHRNGDIRGYQIAYAISDVITGRTLFRTVYNEGRRENILESTITKLRPKTRYSVSVSAFTVRGAGPASPPKYVTTLGEVPNAPRLEARRADNGKAQLRWSSPVLPKGRITGYALRYRCQEEGANAMCPWKTRLFDHNVEQFTPEDVIPGWTYQFFLSASNSDGPGVEASAQINLPPIAPSDAPANLSATTVLDVPGKDGSSPPTPYALNITWSPLTRTQSNGRILEYALYWSPSTIGSSQPERLLTNRTYYWFINVLPNQKYEFNVAAVNSAGEGDRSPGLIVTVTPPLHPTDPRRKSNITISDLGLAEVSTTTVWLRWLPPSGIDVDSYKVSVNNHYPHHREANSANVLQQETEIPEVGVRNLRPNTAYNFTLTTQHTGGDTDGWPSWLVARTSPQLLHTQPYVLNISEHGTVQVVLSRATNFATVKRYSVVVVPVNKKDVRHPSTLNHEVLVSNSISMKKRRRRRQMPYITAEFDAIDIEQIFVVGDAINYGGYINQVLVRGLSYKVFLRAMLKTPVSVECGQQVGVHHKLTPIHPTIQPNYAPNVSHPCTPKYISLYTPHIISQPPQINPHFTPQFLSFTSSPVSEIFFIPSSRQSSLNPDPTDPTLLESSSDQLWILGPILAAIVILLIVFIILYTRRKKSKSGNQVKYMKPVSKHVTHEPHIQHDPVKMRRQNCKTPGMPSHPPISIHTFQHHVEQLRANDNLKFSQEYESIDPGQQFTWAQSTLEVNKPKNRYANVISYDHSRLTLSPIDGVPGSDYINANYISGFRRQNAYIATQGPMRETVSDFWRMVWEQRSSIICMMTKCEERCKVKCEQYWPSGGSETYGLISVTLIDELELATYCVRTFNVVKVGHNIPVKQFPTTPDDALVPIIQYISYSGLSDRREIKHFQFTAWPDHGVPEHPTPVLNFMRRVKSHHQPDAGPIVVHCSAGVGRAGCFICIDAMLERIKYEETVDVYGQVTCMRAERNYMVQTEDQYIFIHDALLEAINSGNTELPAKDLFNHLHKLTTPDPDHPITGMELEFKRLASNKASASRFVSANLPCNKFKNRLVNILPYEGTRVCLQPIRGVEGSDYINASFIDGYRQKRAYIATQGPLPETTDDFWRTLWEHNSTIVVMLTKLREQGRDKCHQYWPAERSARYQYFVVDPMSEYSMQQYMLREFKVTDARDGQSRTVRQFQFTDWPEQAVPKSGEGFIDFIGQVHKTKEQFGQEGPITIHCSGVGRTGVFITLSLALERMRFENLVDMFQTVKMLRTQRPAMVQTEDQYQFCYRAALEYLGSFDHYAM